VVTEYPWHHLGDAGWGDVIREEGAVGVFGGGA
jgi:hypothetical protein